MRFYSRLITTNISVVVLFQSTTSSAYVGKEMPFISMSKEEVFFKNKTFTDFIESILREWYYFTTENAIRNGICKVL